MAFGAAGCQVLLGIDPDVAILDGGKDAARDGSAPHDSSIVTDSSGTDAGEAAAATTAWVYDDGAFSWPSDLSFSATPNYMDTTGAPLSGSYDIKVTLTGAFGGWAPLAPGNRFDVTGYKSIRFALKPTRTDQQWSCLLQKTDGVVATMSANVLDYGPAPIVGKWGVYTIPLEDLESPGAPVYKLIISDQTGVTSNYWYVDNVGFLPN